MMRMIGLPNYGKRDVMLNGPSRMRMPQRRTLFGIAVAILVSCFIAVWLHLYHVPASQARAQIFQGVFLTVEDAQTSAGSNGKTMIVEVHWDTPGVRIVNRPFSDGFDPEDPTSRHYELEFSDSAIRRSKAAILMNTCLYHPSGLFQSFPGRPVRSVETIINNGQASHVHEHSYLLYWDAQMGAHLLLDKPPDQTSLDTAITGLGMQGVQVRHGTASLVALDDRDQIQPRSFIGIDPTRRVLFLMAFENASGQYMIERAISEGVVFGGQLDSGDSTNLIIGEKAKGVKPYSGLRNLRPLGPYITIHAKPLDT